MNNSKNKKTKIPEIAARRTFICALSSFFLVNFSEAKTMKVILDVVLFNYLNRPIFDVFVDGKVGMSSGIYPYTGGATVMNVNFDLGIKKISWRLGGPEGMPRNGDTIISRNRVKLDSVKPGTKYLAVHIYPDETVELLMSVSYPDISNRGELEVLKMGK